MPRTSLNHRRATAAEDTDEVWIALVTLTHAQLATPLRISTDPTTLLALEPQETWGTRSRGETYLYVGLELVMPDDQEGQAIRARLVLENVGGAIGRLVRSVRSPADVKIEIVTGSTPDLVERRYVKLLAVGAPFSATEVAVEISRSQEVDDPYPGQRTTKDRFPGLHR